MSRFHTVVSLGLAISATCIGTASQGAEHWTYSGTHSGPAEWGALSPDFVACKVGRHQSPIDIRSAQAADLPAITFHYQPAPLALIDNGHTIQVNYAPGSWIDVDGARYDLVQFHFHKPSEEKIDGKSHAMVAHLVHKNAEGKLAVVAVLLDGGGANATIDTVWKNLPKEKEKQVVVPGATVDASALLPKDRGYYTFEGSLTTPPCSEDVKWLVLKEPNKIADAEIAEFGKIYPMNARPTQPTNGRSIQETR
jgi:carbonic anhydrase